MGSQRERKDILKKIMKSFIEADKQGTGIDMNKLISEICMSNGVTIKKAKEYIDTLINAELIEQDSLGIWLSKKYKETVQKELE